MKSRVLVAGAAGFLGSHLTDRLVTDGHEVLGVDNLSTGNLDNLNHLRHESKFSFEQRDICETFDPGPVNYVFNFASPASPPQYMRLGIETLRAGSVGTESMLRIADQYNAGFLHASTSECYGDPLDHPQPESYWGNVNPIGPRSVYDEAKRYAESLVMAYCRYRKVNTHQARIFNTYGPRLDPNDGRVISNFMSQALRGLPLTIYGDGSQTRSFCYVSDLIEGIVRLSGSDEHLPVNLGNPEEFTVLECAQAIVEITHSAKSLRYHPALDDDPARRRPDISKARTLLGWDPRIPLREGLELSLPYFRERLNGQSGRMGATAADSSGISLALC